MKLALGREEESFADEARTWLNEHLVGEFAQCRGVGGPADDDAWDVRIAWEQELAAGGWVGISWPTRYGGRGGTVRQEVIFALEAARLNPPYRASVQGLELLGPMLLAFGSEAQKRRFLPRILAVEESWAQGFSEPGAGSDIAAVRTRARLDGGQWILDGQKIWTSIGARADWLYVLARSDPASERHRGLSMLLVPVAQDGVTIQPIRNPVRERRVLPDVPRRGANRRRPRGRRAGRWLAGHDGRARHRAWRESGVPADALRL